MTPSQKIRYAVLKLESEWAEKELEKITKDNIDDIYYMEEEFGEADHHEAEDEIRCSGVETGLPENYSRNYESKEVAIKTPDQSWVGFTYWYGGGKHGRPGEIDWMSDAYNVSVKEQVETVIVRKFSKQKETE